MSRLLGHALIQMKEAGQTLSCLHPFYVPFYRRFGWEIYCEYKKYTIPTGKFPAKVQTNGRVVRDAGGIEVLEPLYDRFASRYNGTLVRDKDWWEHSILDGSGHYAVYYTEAGEAEGYVLYNLENKELTIDEFVHVSREARQGLWTFIANHDSMVTQANVKLAPADDNLPFLLTDPRIPQENYPYFMARIVDVKSFVEKLRFSSDQVVSSIVLSITDPLAPWNEGSWRFTVDADGKASLEPLPSAEGSEAAACSIGTLSAMLLGYKRPLELHDGGLLSGAETAAGWLEDRIPHAKTALFDFF